MASFSQVRRILHIHPAHRSVGVSGVASSFRRYRPAECPSAGKPMDAPIRVLLVSRRDYKLSAAAMAAFEGTLRGRDGIQCNRMDLARFEEEGLAEADCAVVFGRGLQIIGRWSDIDAELAGEDGVEEDEGFQIEIEVPAAARWHPVVKGIGPFVGRAARRFVPSSPRCGPVARYRMGRYSASDSLGTRGWPTGILHVVG